MLLILAGISIASLTGENGILTKADTAKRVMIEEEEKEQLSLAYNGAKTEKLQNSDTNNVVAQELQAQLDRQNTKATAIDKGNKIKTTFQETGNEYIINSSKGTIEKAKEEIPITFEILGTTFTANLGDTWEDFFNLDLEESHRQQSEWAIHYIEKDNKKYIMAGGRYSDTHENMWSAQYVTYEGKRVEMTDTIEKSVYQLEEPQIMIDGGWPSAIEGPWREK